MATERTRLPGRCVDLGTRCKSPARVLASTVSALCRRRQLIGKFDVDDRTDDTHDASGSALAGLDLLLRKYLFSHLILQSRCAADDLGNLRRDSALAYAVIQSDQRFDRFGSVVRQPTSWRCGARLLGGCRSMSAWYSVVRTYAGSKRSSTASRRSARDPTSPSSLASPSDSCTPSAPARPRHGVEAQLLAQHLLGSVLHVVVHDDHFVDRPRSRTRRWHTPRRTCLLHRRIRRRSANPTSLHLSVGEVPDGLLTAGDDLDGRACGFFPSRTLDVPSTLLLKPPARPRSDTTTTNSTFFTSSIRAQQRVIGATYTVATLANISTMESACSVAAATRSQRTDLRTRHHLHGTRNLLRPKRRADALSMS